MGSVAKVLKRATRVIKKPLSKITKGIARGIAKVGKSVMKGVSKISNKLGPVGMIALAVAMPYALTALGGGATGGMIGLQGGTTGWMNSTNLFLKSIGNVGNAIRTGYTATTGAIRTGVGNTWSSITKSIGKGFQKFSGGKGNIWTRISNGAKRLFNSARATVQKFKPFTSPGGSVDVTGQIAKGPASWGGDFMTQTMTNVQAQAALQAGTITGDQLVGQSLGKTGWLTKANPMDKAITNTINEASKNNISRLTGDSLRHYNDILNHSMQNNSYINNQEIFDQVIQNKGTNYQGITDFDGVYNSDLGMTGDYTKIGTTAPGTPTEYTFTGEKTFDNPIGKRTINKKPSKWKKAALSLSESLLSPAKPIESLYEVAGLTDMTMETGTTGYTGTNLAQAMGTDFFRNVFGDNAYERIKTSYKHMNLTV